MYAKRSKGNAEHKKKSQNRENPGKAYTRKILQALSGNADKTELAYISTCQIAWNNCNHSLYTVCHLAQNCKCFLHFQSVCLGLTNIKEPSSWQLLVVLVRRVGDTGIDSKLKTYGKSKPNEPLNVIHVLLLVFLSFLCILSFAMRLKVWCPGCNSCCGIVGLPGA